MVPITSNNSRINTSLHTRFKKTLLHIHILILSSKVSIYKPTNTCVLTKVNLFFDYIFLFSKSGLSIMMNYLDTLDYLDDKTKSALKIFEEDINNEFTRIVSEKNLDGVLKRFNYPKNSIYNIMNLHSELDKDLVYNMMNLDHDILFYIIEEYLDINFKCKLNDIYHLKSDIVYNVIRINPHFIAFCLYDVLYNRNPRIMQTYVRKLISEFSGSKIHM